MIGSAPRTARSRDSRRSRRRGAVSAWFLVAAPVVVAAFALAVHVSYDRHKQLELQITCDAAALAGADALVDDRLLTERGEAVEEVLATARLEACRLAEHNRVGGRPLKLDPNWDNDIHGHVLLGTLDNPFSKAFDELLCPASNLYQPRNNAVRIAGRYHHVAAAATAFVDRDILGFRLTGTIALPGQDVPSIPVMPLAVVSDPCAPAGDCLASWLHARQDSWEHQIMARQGSDEWSVFAPAGHIRSGPDGIPEMKVVISRPGRDALANGKLIGVGGEAIGGALRQFQTGMTAPDLMDHGGQLLLNDSLNEKEPRNELFLPALTPDAADLGKLASALGNILGEQRVWMIYSGASEPGTDDRLRIVGFVAARVVDVCTHGLSETKHGENVIDQFHDGSGQIEQIIVTLQPCMLITATAVTLSREEQQSSPLRRNWGPRTLFNPYVCKVRLTE